MGRTTALLTHGRPLKGLLLCLGILTTRKRVYKFLYANLVRHLSSANWFYVRLDCFLVAAYRIHKIPSCPKVPVPVLILQVACRSNIIRLLFPFSVSHNLGYAVLRRDAYQHADVVWACLCFYDFYALLLAQLPQYDPMSSFIFTYISIRLYFGANTTWH